MKKNKNKQNNKDKYIKNKYNKPQMKLLKNVHIINLFKQKNQMNKNNNKIKNWKLTIINRKMYQKLWTKLRYNFKTS